MPHKRSNTAVIKGTSLFPIDMLRYDRCFPATEKDALMLPNLAINGTVNGVSLGKGFSVPEWEIKLTKSHSDNWTFARWASFGCTVHPE